jgi:hypothetical protein
MPRAARLITGRAKLRRALFVGAAGANQVSINPRMLAGLASLRSFDGSTEFRPTT